MTAPPTLPPIPADVAERDRHELERSVLRGSVITWLVVTAGTVLWWWRVAHLSTRSFSFLVLGLTLYQMGAKVFALWRLSRPAGILPYTAEHAAPGGVTPLSSAVIRPVFAGMPRETFVLVACITVVFVLELAIPDSQLMRAALVPDRVRAGEWSRLLTSAFVHAGLLHFWMNLAAIRTLGVPQEVLAPPSRLPLVFVVAALAGNALSLLLYPHTPSVGASGGIMGFVGYLLALSWRRPGSVSRRLRGGLLATVGLTAYIGVFGFQFINNAAHGGGLLGGALVALLDVRTTEALTHSRRGRMLDVLGTASRIVMIGFTLVTLAQMSGWPR